MFWPRPLRFGGNRPGGPEKQPWGRLRGAPAVQGGAGTADSVLEARPAGTGRAAGLAAT